MEESASEEIQQEESASIKIETSSEIKNQNERLVNKVKTMFEKLEPPISTKFLIYKVPYLLRQWNKGAYTPQVISIGPIHHNNNRLQTMEKHKVRYFKSFLQTAEIELETLVSTIREMEDSIRRCYLETVQLGSDKFVKMIMLDTVDDPIFVEYWLRDTVRQELLLLENQLPFFVIQKIYDLASPSYICVSSRRSSLIQLSFIFFDFFNNHKKKPEPEMEIQHFTDLLRFFQQPPPHPNKKPNRVPGMTLPKYSATQLRDAGVKVDVISDKSVSEWDLNFKNGVLKIPRLLFEDSTEARVRNIMALEQCRQRMHSTDEYVISDFYLILDHLVNTSKDVDLLSDKGIIVNWLGDSNTVKCMINNLNLGIITSRMNSDYNLLCKDLNDFYEKTWHRWKALLRHQYFGTPWRAASTIAAIILLGLTLIQTVCSIIQIVPIFKI
ncbi:hypothetical protein ACB094_02G203500 [Castanea mollissima]